MSTISFKTKDQVADERLQSFRDSTKVSAFQARAVLRREGLIEGVKSIMESPDTDDTIKDAWAFATEFRRSSPTVALFKSKLELTDEQIDDLFRAAAEIEA